LSRSHAARRARTRRWPRSRCRKTIARARSPSCRRSSPSTSTTSRRRGSWPRCCSRRASTIRRRSVRSRSGSSPSILSTPPPNAPDDRYAGLQWRFVRIKYHYITEGTRFQQQEYYGEPWYIDAPAAEQNLSRRVKTATAIQVEDPIVLSLDDPRLFTYPWIYF